MSQRNIGDAWEFNVGLGDWLMATAQAKALNEASARPVFVVGGDNRPQWCEDVFANNPRLTRHAIPGCQRLVSGGGVRPYIAGKTAAYWTWKSWEIQPGELYFTAAEKTYAEQYRGRIMIEPHTKVPQGNKYWEWNKWQQVVDQTAETFIQCGLNGTRWLRGVRGTVTTFRQAAAILSVSRAFVGSEGALHHVAAAVGVPAVVLWSHYIHPQFTGYASHVNIRHAEGWCGARLPCAGCRASMEAITVDEVVTSLREELR